MLKISNFEPTNWGSTQQNLLESDQLIKIHKNILIKNLTLLFRLVSSGRPPAPPAPGLCILLALPPAPFPGSLVVYNKYKLH